ncbi:hypothetical protein [Flavobacterium macacae]|uniref:Uncharacterized protein n=1 Tax=Flavobacterium macacae TaxID=2488993 RepID=A0A3P3W5Y2_9FLAO|nr:hypothetical protein [Flavobacterium macacae]RRJ90410.1 hypothetical protein EG849_10225 [Flavobacterium macacae]
MNIGKYLKWLFLFIISLGLISCVKETKSNNLSAKTSKNIQDTIIVKQKQALNRSYEVGFLSKSHSYYWLVGKDTLDIVVNVREYSRDSTLHLGVHHKDPMLFASLLTKINECYPQIEIDFDLSKFNSFYFRQPIYYLDLANDLSTEYEQQFGQKSINYEKLNQFLLNSKLNKQLGNLVKPLHKKVKLYRIEKFHLMDKIHYVSYLPNVDLIEYPAFTIHGMGLYAQLENK